MHSMLIHSSTNDSTACISELIRLSAKAETPQATKESIGVYAKDEGCELRNYAAPFVPLQERDEKAMEDLFERQDAEEIEANINKCLLWLWPEPCWEDDPFDFLSEYL